MTWIDINEDDYKSLNAINKGLIEKERFLEIAGAKAIAKGENGESIELTIRFDEAYIDTVSGELIILDIKNKRLGEALYKGEIKYLKWWNHALSQKEIAEEFRKGLDKMNEPKPLKPLPVNHPDLWYVALEKAGIEECPMLVNRAMKYFEEMLNEKTL